MTTFKDMPLDATLQKGYIVTVTGPGEHDVTVREVMGVHEHTGPFVSDMASTTIRFAHLISGLTRTLTRVQRPVPALPTVPGYYMSDKHVHSLLPRMYELRIHDQWYGNSGKVTEARMRELMPLTRLVPETEVTPAKLADRIDVQKLADVMSREYHGSSDYWDKDAAAIIAAIDGGECDK